MRHEYQRASWIKPLLIIAAAMIITVAGIAVALSAVNVLSSYNDNSIGANTLSVNVYHNGVLVTEPLTVTYVKIESSEENGAYTVGITDDSWIGASSGYTLRADSNVDRTVSLRVWYELDEEKIQSDGKDSESIEIDLLSVIDYMEMTINGGTYEMGLKGLSDEITLDRNTDYDIAIQLIKGDRILYEVPDDNPIKYLRLCFVGAWDDVLDGAAGYHFTSSP